MGKRGAKPWEPTEQERKKVRLYAGLGMTQEQIGALIGKSVDSLDRYCREDLDTGKAEIISKVAGSLVRKAMNGDTTSAIFYLKTQARWKETHLIGSDPDNPLPAPVTLDASKLSAEALREVIEAAKRETDPI
jgi:hypothetical protein